MKKLFILWAILCVGMPSWAQLQPGTHRISGHLGLGFQLNNSGISYSQYRDTVDWGVLGGEWGLSYQYIWRPHLSVGAELGGGSFSGGDLDLFGGSDDVSDTTHILNTWLAARLTLNPQHRMRWYIPLGVGMATVRQDIDIQTRRIHYQKKATDHSVAWFTGLGVEFDVGEKGWSWGLETRYHAFWYNTDKLVRGTTQPVYASGRRRYEYLTFGVRLDKRF